MQTPKEATQVEINVVGKLSEYCAKWKIPAPHFKDEKEELLTGNQHEFTTSCTLFNVSEECRKLTVEGKGLKKTLSKREAALNMLTKLREMEIDIDAVPVKEEPKAQDEAPANGKASQTKDNESRCSLFPSIADKSFAISPLINQLTSLLTTNNNTTDHHDILLKRTQAMGLSLEASFLPSKTNRVCVLSVKSQEPYSVPLMSSFGIGFTEISALNSASKCAFELFVDL